MMPSMMRQITAFAAASARQQRSKTAKLHKTRHPEERITDAAAAAKDGGHFVAETGANPVGKARLMPPPPAIRTGRCRLKRPWTCQIEGVKAEVSQKGIKVQAVGVVAEGVGRAAAEGFMPAERVGCCGRRCSSQMLMLLGRKMDGAVAVATVVVDGLVVVLFLREHSNIQNLKRTNW